MTKGEIIRKLREEKGISMAELANRIGVGRQVIYKYENNIVTNIPSNRIEDIAIALQTSPDIIMGWTLKNEAIDNEIPVQGLVPIVGRIAAGTPIFATENIEGYLPTVMRQPEEYFFLRVKGDSMINAGINDGALVLIHKQDFAEEGQITACGVNGDEATLKRFTRQGDTVLLLSENSKYTPILIPASSFENGYARIYGVAKQVVTELA